MLLYIYKSALQLEAKDHLCFIFFSVMFTLALHAAETVLQMLGEELVMGLNVILVWDMGYKLFIEIMLNLYYFKQKSVILSQFMEEH